MGKTYFVTGIDTEIGKTIASAVLVECLKADYWKPIQSGDLPYSDSHKIDNWISNKISKIHPNTYALTKPLSPHISSAIDGVVIELKHIVVPTTENDLVIEGAGGLMVPLNSRGDMMADIIPKFAQVILVTKHYLGSINHTLLSLNELHRRGFQNVILLINGMPNISTEIVLKRHPAVDQLWRLNELDSVNKESIRKEADNWKSNNITS